MRVLLTGSSLSIRAGHDPSSRQLARVLQARGHSVIASGSHPAQLPRVLEIDWTPVAPNPSLLEDRPDIIHACHFHDVFWALAALQDIPAVLHLGNRAFPAVAHPRIYRRLFPSTARKQVTPAAHPADAGRDVVLPEAEDQLGQTLEEIYTQVIEEHGARKTDWQAESDACLDYLRLIFPELMAVETLNPAILLGGYDAGAGGLPTPV